MPTRLKKPAIWRPLALSAALLLFQGYLGFSVIGGQFGTENRKQIIADIEVLRAKTSALQAEIDSYKHRASLMDSRRLDPDLIGERARALLNMANPDDVIVMVDPETGEPISSSYTESAENKLNVNLSDIIDN